MAVDGRPDGAEVLPECGETVGLFSGAPQGDRTARSVVIKSWRAALLAIVMLAVFDASSAGQAQLAGKTSRVGFLRPGGIPPSGPLHDVFWSAVRESGWVLGKNVAVEERGAEGRLDQLPELAADLVRAKVDVIIAITTPSVRAAKQATTTIPIVMVLAGDPLGDGLVANLARPGGNVTGVTHLFSEMVEKTLQLVRELLPNASRVAVLYPQNATIRRVLNAAQPAAKFVGLSLDHVELDDPRRLAGAFESMRRAKTDAVYVIGAGRINERRAVELASRFRIPDFHATRGTVEAGGLMAYWGDDVETWRGVGRYVGRILNGANPRDLPVEQPSRVGLAINLKTAKALGLTVPSSLLLRADHVIE